MKIRFRNGTSEANSEASLSDTDNGESDNSSTSGSSDNESTSTKNEDNSVDITGLTASDNTRQLNYQDYQTTTVSFRLLSKLFYVAQLQQHKNSQPHCNAWIAIKFKFE